MILEDKALIGIWILLNILWVISWIITGIRFLIQKAKGRDTYMFERIEFSQLYLDIPLAVIWFIIGIVALGSYIGTLL